MIGERAKKITEKDHINTVGRPRFFRAIGRAMLVLREDRRLVGLDRIRNQLANEAALQGTGFPVRPLVLSDTCGHGGAAAMQTIAEELLGRAIEAVRDGQ